MDFDAEAGERPSLMRVLQFQLGLRRSINARVKDLAWKHEQNESILRRIGKKATERNKHFLQHLAQQEVFASSDVAKKNVLALASFPFVFLFLLVQTIQNIRHQGSPTEHVFISNNNPLLCKYSHYVCNVIRIKDYRIEKGNRYVLDRNVLIFWFKKWLFAPAPRHIAFHLKALLFLCKYNAVMRHYQPRSIYSFMEYSDAGPITTQFLNSRNCRHENIMHGHKDFSVKDSAFSIFNTVYVWGEYYANLFYKLGMETEEYVIIGHPTHRQLFREAYSYGRSNGLVVILALPDSNWPHLAKLSNELQQAGIEVYFKPHPVYGNAEAIEFFSDRCGKKSVLLEEAVDALNRNCCFWGGNSSLVIEAWLLSKRIILFGQTTFPPEITESCRTLKIPDWETLDHDRLVKFIVQPIFDGKAPMETGLSSLKLRKISCR